MKLTLLGKELTEDEKRFLGMTILGVPKIALSLIAVFGFVCFVCVQLDWLDYWYAWCFFGMFALWLICGIAGAEQDIENYRNGLIKQQKIATEPKPSRHYTRRLKGESDEEYLIRILEKQAQYGGADAIYKRLKYYYEMYELDRKKRTPNGLRCRKERKDV